MARPVRSRRFGPATVLAAGCALAALGLAAAPAAVAQNGQPACQQAAAAEPATPKGSGQENGSAPANAGNTGWTGGTGGSYVGTTPAGANPSSPTIHPEVARGLDPMKSTPRPKAC